MNKLSKTMQNALSLIQDYGCIVRYPGGFWAEPHCEMKKGGEVPANGYFNINTLEALEKRKLIVAREWRVSKCGKFPIRFEPV